jgi:hypothetical protein
MAEEKKQMPRKMALVIQQINDHPDCKTKLTDGDRFAVSVAAGGYTKHHKQDNDFLRSYWRYLHLPDAPHPDKDPIYQDKWKKKKSKLEKGMEKFLALFKSKDN